MDNHMVSGNINNNNTVDPLDRPDGPGVSLVVAVYRGFPVRARRTPQGHWCGYLSVPVYHPWVQTACTGEDGAGAGPCESRLLSAIDVHGGCTYAEFEGEGVGDRVLTVGFDCAHLYDSPPPWMSQREAWGGTYRDLRYVRAELLSLAEQAEAAAREADR